MNVTFKIGEKINGYEIKSQNGLTQFVVENEDYIIVFHTDAGEGKNYSKVIRYTNKHNNRSYQGQRYLYKFVSTVQGFSNVLYQKYKQQNNIK